MSYLGLRSTVCYRIEIGLAYIDDGATVHRFDETLFAQLRDGVELSTDEAFDPARALLERFPSVFAAYDDHAWATQSFAVAELAEALAS